MAAVRGLRVLVKSAAAGVVNEPEPMEVEEGEVEAVPDAIQDAVQEAAQDVAQDVPQDVQEGSSPREVVSVCEDNIRRYENKAGTFITGIDVTSKEAIEKKEQRAKRFHFRAEVSDNQRNVVLDRDMMRKALPKLRLETLHVVGVDDLSTEDIFTFFKQYPPGYIEWLDDTSCNVVWLDEVTAARALLNLTTMPVDTKDKKDEESTSTKSKADRFNDSSGDETEEGEVDEDNPSDAEKEPNKITLNTMDTLSEAEQESLMRNDLRPAMKLFKENQLQMRYAYKDDKKELGASRKSQYYMKYGNPNYGGMKGILSNSWKRRYNSRRVQRDVTKKGTFIGDDAPAYQHLHSEEPIEEEEEDEEDMDEDDRVVVEYRDELQAFKREREGARRSAASTSEDSDEMDYDLELKMISTPSPKKSMKMTMYADEVESQLKTIRHSMRSDSGSSVKNRIGSKSHSEKPADIRLLLEEKRQSTASRQTGTGTGTGTATGTKSDVRQRLGKRPHSPEVRKVSSHIPTPRREPVSDVHSRLGLPKQLEGKGLYSDTKEKKTGGLWNRLGTAPKEKERAAEKEEKSSAAPEEDDSVLQQAWGALIKEKEEIRQKKSRLDNLPSLQIEISRESSSGSDTDS
ncbi:nuclear cap-binding protein subunit 3 isoform X2 [Rana temporaria]|uniref:nuclear cap-binding protein subunit 3 isoform X2 n=1 Tax=Rana temporaria TaxID=8407 RepID=UPI001AAC92FA|nr:nuclear cap-binding protein subunit 3 isoform X2 [Rana temporaria]